MLVKFDKSWVNWRINMQYDLPPGTAEELVKRGIAKYVLSDETNDNSSANERTDNARRSQEAMRTKPDRYRSR